MKSIITTNKGSNYKGHDLWAFLSRVDSKEKVAIAREWIDKNVDDIPLWEDLMMALSFISRELNRAERMTRDYTDIE